MNDELKRIWKVVVVG